MTGRTRPPAGAPSSGAGVRQPAFRDQIERLSPAWRILGRMMMFVAPVVLLSLLAGVVIYVRLAHGPVSLKVLAGPIERGISAELPGLTAQVDDTLLERTESGEYEFRLVNLRLLDADGTAVASAPVAEIGLDPSSLAMLQLRPRRVELVEPRLAVSYRPQDGFSLSFKDVPAAASADAPAAEASPPQAGGALPDFGGSALPSIFKRLDLARMLADYSARARRQEDATASLSQIGLRNAIVDIDYDGQRSQWKVPEVAIDLDHRSRRSVISGMARIDSDRGPWAISFLTEDSDKTNLVTVKASVRDLVPSALGRTLPALALLRSLELPVAGNATIEIKTSGELNTAGFGIELGRGLIDFGPSLTTPLLIDAGLFTLTYDAASSQFTVQPSTLKWGGSRVTLTGTLTSDTAEGRAPSWLFDLKSTDGELAADEFKVPPVPLEAFGVSGRLEPSLGHIEIANFGARAGGTDLAFKGEVLAGDGPQAGVRLQGQIAPVDVAVGKVLWPRMVGPRARDWVGDSVRTGVVKDMTVSFASGVFTGPDAVVAKGGIRERTSIALKVEGAEIVPFKDGPPIRAPLATVSVENADVDIAVPDATIVTGATGKGLALKAGRFTAQKIDDPLPIADVTFRALGGFGTTLEAMRLLKFGALKTLDLPTDVIDGKFDGQFKIKIPLSPELDPDAIGVEGKAKIVEVKSKEKIGLISVQSGSIDVELGAKDAFAKGELILNGILAKLDWKRSIDATAGKQPPLAITANLDNADRKQLGLDINDYVQGEVPVAVTFETVEAPVGADGVATAEPTSVVRVRADLTAADFSIDELAWKKPRGRPAQLQFDVGSSPAYKTVLQNFKITGDQIAVEGWVGLGPDQKPQEFAFPNFSLNLVSRMDVSGKRGGRNIWDVKARGTTFDGRDFFQSLFSFSGGSSQRVAKEGGGVDLKVELDNVLGHSDVALRGFKMQLSRRGDKISALTARGTLDGGQPLAAELRVTGAQRIIYADSTDAGQALRLVGFYPNMKGGRVRVEVDLDARGAAEKAGIVWIDDFKVLGDPVVAEVFSGAGSDGPAISATPPGGRRVVREVFEFDRMKIPFSVGYGQFVVEDSYVKGPILGATLRGKLDYGAQKVNLGGTYVPLQGLNNALGEIPLLGQILSGPRGEGIFGITFAIQGPMAGPQVIVNPLSLVAPGIFREIFQMSNPNTAVLPRGPTTPSVPVEQRVRASSTGGEPATSGAQDAPIVDGWSSDTVVPTKRN